MTSATSTQPAVTSIERGLLWLIPILAVLGPSVPGIGSFFSFRLAAIGLFVVAFLNARGAQAKTPIRLITAAFAISMVLFGLLGIMFNDTNSSSGAELISVVCGVALILSVLIMRSPAMALRYLSAGWTVSFYLCAAVAAREIVFGVHWFTYFKTEQLDTSWGIASTLGNPNNYALYLLASVGMLTVGYATSRNKFVRWANVIALISIPFLALETQSRLGTILTTASLVIVAFGYRPTRRLTLVVGSLALVSLVALQLSGYTLEFRDEILTSTTIQQYRVSLFGQEIPLDGSTFVRWNLTLNGLLFFADAPLLGHGPGSFEDLTASGASVYPTFDMTNPHNGLIEILSQYGILPATLFGVWWIALLIVAIRGVRASSAGSLKRLIALALVAFSSTLPFALVMNSSFLDPSTVWLALAAYTLLAIAFSRQSYPDDASPDELGHPEELSVPENPSRAFSSKRRPVRS